MREPRANMEAASSFSLSDSASESDLSDSELESCSELEDSLLAEGIGEAWAASVEDSDNFFCGDDDRLLLESSTRKGLNGGIPMAYTFLFCF